jgi:hypothetical protein
MKRDLKRRYSVVFRPGAAGPVAVALAALAFAGCGPRTYPTHAVLVDIQQDGGGALEVHVAFNRCPTLTFNVSPMNAPVGQPFTVSGNGADADGDHLTYSLTANSGYFNDPSSNNTVFNCTVPGPVEITLTVSDGSCSAMQSIPIFCLGAEDGGVISGTGGAGTGGRSGGVGGSGGAGGASGGGTGGAPGPTNTCPNEPTNGIVLAGGATCDQCTVDNCSLGPPPMFTDGCCGLPSTSDQLLCEAAALCFASPANQCTLAGDATNCFCGTNLTTCFSVPGAANGPCVAQVFAAAKSKDPPTIKSVFTSSQTAIGRAVNLLGCQGVLCQMECSIR